MAVHRHVKRSKRGSTWKWVILEAPIPSAVVGMLLLLLFSARLWPESPLVTVLKVAPDTLRWLVAAVAVVHAAQTALVILYCWRWNLTEDDYYLWASQTMVLGFPALQCFLREAYRVRMAVPKAAAKAQAAAFSATDVAQRKATSHVQLLH